LERITQLNPDLDLSGKNNSAESGFRFIASWFCNWQ
jgi:hypothetical protein